MSIRSSSEGYQQSVIPISDPQSFGLVRMAVEQSFSSASVVAFLDSIERANLRVRDFEIVLGKGMLGRNVLSEYTRLGDGDRGMIREIYLSALEHVTPELRRRFLKLYAYY